MRSRNETTRRDEDAPRRWSLADDYLADPAVAPLRALVAAVARRVATRRGGRSGGARGEGRRQGAGTHPSPGMPHPA